jgi:uncharacterized oxidoreductase
MKTTNNTILVSGGSAGIGFEIAKQFSEKGNTVIITGRDEERLEKAVAKLKNTTAIVADVTNEEDVNRLVAKIKSDFPALNIVINNAGRAVFFDPANGQNGSEKAGEEMLTNYLSVIRINEKLLPLLKQQTEAAIVHVSSIVAFAPRVHLSTYAASKAAVHSYSQSLRFALKDSSVKVFELMPPLVNTEFSKEIGGERGIAPSVVANDLLHALEENEYEIHVGQTAELYKLFLSSPNEALVAMNS